MKKAVTVLVVLSLTVINGFAATSLDWGSEYAVGSGTTQDDVLDPDGVVVPSGRDWYLQLYDTSVDYDPENRTAGQLASSEDAFPIDGVALTSISGPQSWEGITAGTRLFNHNDPNQATQYALGSLETTLSNLDDPAGNTPEADEYNFGVIGQNGSEWQAVPEPAVTLFALIGVGTIFYRRRRMRNQ